MAVLIVDDEITTRQALRILLADLGHRSVLEARNGVEALKILDSEKARIRLIIADADMPYMDGFTLVRKVSDRPFLDLAPFLLITSDLSRSELEKFARFNQRLDHCLTKPFRQKSLATAIQKAHEARARSRDGLLAVSSPAFTQLLGSVVGVSDQMHWRKLTRVEDGAHLKQILKEDIRGIGAVLVEPAAYAALGVDWLSSFKKSPQGTMLPIVCLSRDPSQILDLRLHCQLFVEVPKTVEQAAELLGKLTRRTLCMGELEALASIVKASLSGGQRSVARKAAERMVRLEPDFADGHNFLGEILESSKKIEAAIGELRESIRCNPCSPRAHLRLMTLLPMDAEVARQAVAFCPANSDILLMAAQTLRRLGQIAEAESFTARAEKSTGKNKTLREAPLNIR